MGHRLSRIYTRTGDAGTTHLGDGSRVRKDDARIVAHGCLDELNSELGVVLAQSIPAEMRACLEEIQHTLFDLGGDLCVPQRRSVTQTQVDWLERWLDHFNAGLPPLKEFILPSGNAPASFCHVARTVCRRCECLLATLLREGHLDSAAYAYINRLSDLLFVLARTLARQGGGEVTWQHGRIAPEPPL